MVYNERHTGQSSFSLDTALQTFETPQKTEQTTPRRMRHAALCVVLAGGMLVLVRAGATIHVTDERTGTAVAAFAIEDTSAAVIHGSGGEISLPFSLSSRQVRISAAGYRAATIQTPPIGDRRVALEPLVTSITVRADDSGQPLTEATVDVSLTHERTGPGQFTIWPATGADVILRAPGYESKTRTARDGETVVRLIREPAAVLSNAHTGEPLRAAIVATGQNDMEVKESGVIAAGYGAGWGALDTGTWLRSRIIFTKDRRPAHCHATAGSARPLLDDLRGGGSETAR